MSKPFIMWDFGLGSGWVGVRVGIRCGNVETQYFASPGMGWAWIRIGCDIACGFGYWFDASTRRRKILRLYPGMGWAWIRIRYGIACGFGYWFDASTRRRKILRLYPPPDCCEFPFKFQLFFNVSIDVAAIFVHSWPTMNRYTLLNSGMKDKGE